LNLFQCLPILMLAGEATNEHYYSTTHGAYDSGVKQAKTFLQYHITKWKCNIYWKSLVL